MDTGRLNGWGQPYFWSAVEVEKNLGVARVVAAVEAANLVNNASVGIAKPVAAAAQVRRALRRRQNSPKKFGNVLPAGYTPIKRDFRGVGGHFQCPVVGCGKVLTRAYEIERHVSEVSYSGRHPWSHPQSLPQIEMEI